MPDNYSFTLNDFDGQPGIVGVNIPEVTAANYDTIKGLCDTFRQQAGDLTRGVFVRDTITDTDILGPNNPAPDDLAQRGNKWRVVYMDNTAFLDAPANTIPNPSYRRIFDFSLPTADLTLRDANSNIIYRQGSGVWDQQVLDFVAATEAVVKSPNGGTAFVQYIEAVTYSGG